MKPNILSQDIGSFLVASETTAETAYRVDFEDSTCTCPDFEKRPGHMCKHIASLLGAMARQAGVAATPQRAGSPLLLARQLNCEHGILRGQLCLLCPKPIPVRRRK